MIFTNEEKLEAIERELVYRRRVYGSLVAAGKMTPTFARRQIRIFEAIQADYDALENKERLL